MFSVVLSLDENLRYDRFPTPSSYLIGIVILVSLFVDPEILMSKSLPGP
mgnify:CR=1 FL=1